MGVLFKGEFRGRVPGTVYIILCEQRDCPKTRVRMIFRLLYNKVIQCGRRGQVLKGKFFQGENKCKSE